MAVDAALMQRVILENQEEIPSKPLLKRGERFESGVSYVLVGLRRAGKSYTIFEHIQKLINEQSAKPEDILYVNFEDDRLYGFEVSDSERLLDAYYALFGTSRRPVVCLDELQNIEGWEKFARRLVDTGYQVFITGSNAKMLSSEIHTTLGARFIVREIRPFSFREFLRIRGTEPTPVMLMGPRSNDVRRLFDEYLTWGGLAPVFPLVEKREWLQGLKDNVLLRDIAARSGIRSTRALVLLLSKLAESVRQPTGASRLLHLLQSDHMPATRANVAQWIDAMQAAFLIESMPNWSDALSERATMRKHYLADNGILNCLLADPAAKLLENLAAVELMRRFGRDAVYYYRRNVEVDFFVPQAHLAVQVSMALSSSETQEREVRALVKLAEVFDLKESLILTMDEERTIEAEGVRIMVKPVWRWLLEPDDAAAVQ